MDRGCPPAGVTPRADGVSVTPGFHFGSAGRGRKVLTYYYYNVNTWCNFARLASGGDRDST